MCNSNKPWKACQFVTVPVNDSNNTFTLPDVRTLTNKTVCGIAIQRQNSGDTVRSPQNTSLKQIADTFLEDAYLTIVDCDNNQQLQNISLGMIANYSQQWGPMPIQSKSLDGTKSQIVIPNTTSIGTNRAVCIMFFYEP